MKSFFKSLLASIIGTSIVVFIAIVIVFGIVIASMSGFGSSGSYKLKSKSVLYLDLQGELVDRATKNELLEMLNIEYMGMADGGQLSLSDMLDAIKLAETQSQIEGIYIRSGLCSGGSASFNELRKAILDFKKNSGKFVIAYADYYTQNGYYVSTAADKLFLNPEGMMDVHGYAAQPIFYKGLLDKLGIKVQVFKVGTFKSAVEPYIETKMSPANREQMTTLLNDMWDIYKDDVAQDRGIKPEDVNQAANAGIFLQDTKLSLDFKLADELKYETEVNQYIKTLVGIGPTDKLNLPTYENLNNTKNEIKDKKKDSKNSKTSIAVVYAEGEIYGGNGTKGITDAKFVKILEKLKNDVQTKAVVLRVNSPGGSAFASEQIWKAVTDLKEAKPVIVSMGNYAASGGYYISCNATKIYAQPNTITGSIGIFGLIPDAKGLTDKIGITTDVVKTNTFADQGSLLQPLDDQEKRLMQNFVERGYDLFLTRCAEGRNMTKEEIDKIGQGRVWTGQQALALGLVDELGGINDAIAEAATLANIDRYEIQSYPKVKTFLEILLEDKKDDLVKSYLQSYFGTTFDELDAMNRIKNIHPVQARIPYLIN